MARPTFSDMKTEVTSRLGNHGYTGFPARVERWIEGAYFHFATTYHHPELDQVDESRTLEESTSDILLPDDVKVPIAIALLQPGTSTLDRFLKPRDFHLIQHQFDETEGKPRFVARYGDSLYFDRKSDADYPVRVFYYQIPPLPNFGGGEPSTSPLGEEWDEIIQAGAAVLGYANLWRPDLAALRQQALERYLASVPNSLLAEDMLADRTTKSKRDKSHMGVQG